MTGVKEKCGGKREGAGKPKGINQKAISVRIDNDLVPFIESQPNKNRFINDCIRANKPEQ